MKLRQLTDRAEILNAANAVIAIVTPVVPVVTPPVTDLTPIVDALAAGYGIAPSQVDRSQLPQAPQA